MVRFNPLLVCLLTSLAAANVQAEELESQSFEIVGGQQAAVGNWPEVVFLLLQKEHLCTGVFIGPDVIATAAHCFLDPEEVLTKVDEALERASSAEQARSILHQTIDRLPDDGRIEGFAIADSIDVSQPPVVRTDVAGYRLHPEYLGQFERFVEEVINARQRGVESQAKLLFAYDFAIVYLKKPAASAFAQLASTDTIRNGMALMSVGFGTHNPGASAFDGKLRELPVNVESAGCQGVDGCGPGLEFSFRGPGMQMPCKGDSGSGLFSVEGGQRLVVGILSGILTNNDETPCDGSRPLVAERTEVAFEWYQEMIALGPPAESGGCGCETQRPAEGILSMLLLSLVTVFAVGRRAPSRR